MNLIGPDFQSKGGTKAQRVSNLSDGTNFLDDTFAAADLWHLWQVLKKKTVVDSVHIFKSYFYSSVLIKKVFYSDLICAGYCFMKLINLFNIIERWRNFKPIIESYSIQSSPKRLVKNYVFQV